MKKYRILIILIFAGTFGFSQEEIIIPGDTTRIKLGRTEVIITKDLEPEGPKEMEAPDAPETPTTPIPSDNDKFSNGNYDSNNWIHLYSAHGVSGYMAPDNNISLPQELGKMSLEYPRSRSYTFSFILDGVDLIKDRWYLTTGMGFTQNKYFFKNDVIVSTSNDSTSFGLSDDIVFERNMLKINYFEIPVMTGFRIGNLNRAFGIQFGVIGGLKLNSKVKQKYRVDRKKIRNNIEDDYNLNPFKIDLFARISVGDIGLFGRYSLTNLFEENRGADVNAFAVGLSFSIFDGY